METEDDRRAMYAYFGVLLAFKIFTLIVILWLMSSWEAVVFVVASHVLWLIVGAILIAGPAAFWTRLVRVRARRRQLVHQEWHIEEQKDSVK
jgi:tetrahydromethanopterin S-methyltransferase subunit E